MDKLLPLPSQRTSVGWLVKMAWQDSRRSRGKLALFTLSIVIGLASLVGINSFKENMKDEIEKEALTLLGADLEFSTRQPWTPEQLLLIDSVKGEWSSQTRFASMIYFPRTYGTRLVQVRALTGSFPFYGEIITEPRWAARDLQNGKNALVDEKLMLQFDVELGDEIKVGEITYNISGKLKGVPGQSGISLSVSPVVYIPGMTLEQTGLIKKGSRVVRSRFIKMDNPNKLSDFIENKENRFEQLGLQYETVESQKEDTTEAFDNLTTFLNLATFIALLLGSIGVASAVFIYLRDKRETVAVLRCLGVNSSSSFYIFFFQVIFMGSFGTILGCGLGILLQFYLPQILEEMLPVSITPVIYWQIPLIGMFLGITVSILFSILPLLSLSKVPPLVSIRADFESSHNSKPSPPHLIVYGIMALVLYGFSYFQIREWLEALYFVLGLAGAFITLLILSKGMIFVAQKVSAVGMSFSMRQGIANLHRPKNQTTTLMLTIGLCATLLTTIMLTRLSLLEEIKLADEGERPNMVMFDIQTHQKEELKAMTLDYDLPIIQDVPVVTMRLLEINGTSKKEADLDSTLDLPGWAYNREYRVTFRDSLITSESIAAGALRTVKNDGDSIFISMAEGFAEALNLKLGDKLIWNVQGAVLETSIGSFREIDWRRVQTNFLVLFPEGVLEEAPQFHVLVTKVDKSDVSARFQQAVVRLFPNISIIDLELVLKTVEDILQQISYVINFMALVTILTCIIVLVGSMVLSKDNRIKESVLLRTLGASTKKILLINTIEYLALGGIAAISGVLLSNILTYILSEIIMETRFVFSIYLSAVITISIMLGTTIVGLLNVSTIMRKSPLEVLRKTT